MNPAESSRISSYEREWNRILKEQPFLGRLQTGLHVRNQKEVDDVWNCIDEYSARYYQPQYIGIVGSRQVGKIYWSRTKLIDVWSRVISEASLDYLYTHVLTVDSNFDGRKIPTIPEFMQSDAMSQPPLNEFFYDIDLVIVQNQDSRPLNVKRRIGKKSGTLIEIYSIARQILVENTYQELQEYFYYSKGILR